MTCNNKGPCNEEKAKTVEKLTDEKLDKVSGGYCAPVSMSVNSQADAENKCNPMPRPPKCLPSPVRR